MMKMFKKAAAVLMMLVMALTLCYVQTDTSRAASKAWDGSVDISWYNPDTAAATTEYHLDTPAELAGLAALVNGRTSYDCTGIKYPDGYGDKDYDKFFKAKTVTDFQLVGAGGGNTNDTVYVGSTDMDFDGVTFYLDADMDMGGDRGYNWTPIGGKFPMDTRAYKTIKKSEKPKYAKAPGFDGDCQTIESYFNGILDGQGHDITNLHCDRYTNKGFPYSMAIGLVGYLGGTEYYEDVSQMAQEWIPSVQNLTVSGDVYGRRMVGGIVGRIGDWPDGVTVLNCANKASVKSTDSRGRGGIVGSGGEAAGCRIVNCYNTGKISGTYNTSTGGIIGENDGVSIYNCYNSGTISCSNQDYAMGIGGHDSGSYTVENCYYLKGCAGASQYPGYYIGTGAGLTLNTYEMTGDQMKGSNLLKALNDERTSATDIETEFIGGKGAFIHDSSINGGYPALFFEKSGFSWPKSQCRVTVKDSSLGTVAGSVEGTVPYGTVVCLTSIPGGGNVLDTYTADGKAISADYYTVTSDVTLSADFVKLQKGQIVFKDGTDYYLSGKKSGTVDGTYEHTSNSQVAKTEYVYQLDKITANAVLKSGAKPSDVNREYTGEFEYVFTYSSGAKETSSKGRHTVTSDISRGGLTVTAEPQTRNKLWTTQADTSWYSKSKSSFTLKTPEQLAGLAVLVNSKGVTFKGRTVKLGKNITLENNDGTKGTRYWTAIGSSSAKSFKGTFDGNGKTIKNMAAESSGSYSGLFGYIEGATVKNLTVRGTSQANSLASGVAAFASSSKITGCTSYVNVSAAGDNAGGICAEISGKTTLNTCVNRGTVSGRSMIGGVCGQSLEKTAKVAKCANFGAVTGSDSYAGGVVGKSFGDITLSANKACITADDYAGGICGHTSSWDIPTVKNCYNMGDIKTSGNAEAHLGGLIGYAQYIEMNNCYNAGAVDVTEHYGGAAGMFYKSIDNSIVNTYYSDACDKPLGDTEGEDKEKVKATAMALSSMQSAAFASKLNSVFSGTWVSVSGSTPELKWLRNSGEPADPAVSPVKHDEPAAVQYEYARGGQTLNSGTYYIDPTATGILTIKGAVALDGSKGSVDGLRIDVTNGADLTLKNATLASDASSLLVLDNGTLTLAGTNVLDENCTESGNSSPAILIKSGTGTIKGSGSLSVDTSIGNTPVLLEKGATFCMKSGTVKLLMSERLGKVGGVIDGSTAGNAQGRYTEKYGTVKVSGGKLTVTSDTNNVMAVAVDRYIQTGGTVYFYANEADQQVKRDSYGKAANINTMKLSGGKLYVRSTIHDSTKKVKGIKALQCSRITGTKYIYR